jgi:hypothetical protein
MLPAAMLLKENFIWKFLNICLDLESKFTIWEAIQESRTGTIIHMNYKRSTGKCTPLFFFVAIIYVFHFSGNNMHFWPC